MRKGWDRLRFKKIRSRFFAALILLSVPPLALVGYIAFNISKDTLLETNMQTAQDHLRTTSEVADLMFRNVINLNRSVVLNESIRGDLRRSPSAEGEEQVDIKTRTVDHLQRHINSNFLDIRYIDSICVFDLRFEAYCLGRSDSAGIYEGPDKITAVQNEAWYRATVERQGAVLFFGRNVLGDNPNTFSTAKLFRDADSAHGEPIGLLIVNISKSIFDVVFSTTEENGEFLTVGMSDGASEVIYPRRSDFVSYFAGGNVESAFKELENKNYLSVNYKNETTGWLFVHVVAQSELLKDSSRIGWATVIIGTVISAIALVISFIISGSITKPLLQVKKMMLKWTKGIREFDESFDTDEVGAIGESFKRMLSVNEELNEKLVFAELKERDAELRALQAQIKPHFLYNTLDSIYWMATLQQNHDVAQMAISLSESFKLSLNKGQETISVYKEVKHVHHYLTIQNIRYNNRFTYIEDIDPSVMGMNILKLLLQPLVENAIYHGLEPKIGNGTIRLTGHIEGDEVVFVVEDDGVGIADMEKTEQGYGLGNVRERLRLYYGDSSELRIFSEPGKGTRIELRFQPRQERSASHAEGGRI
ncbi:sensor histidine kinase [Paenibacillus sp. TRM 82003]|nr:sensor histidine kinase [Paenibacillus sp. TRM 82003]